MSLKSEMICCICKLVLSSKHISLPCSHIVCSEHLHYNTAKIRCPECDQETDVPRNGFPINKMVSNILEKDLHLSDEEKILKYAIQTLIQQLDRLQSDLKQKHADLKQISFDHFSEVRRQIDLQREDLKRKIDDIALKMIDLVKENEKVYNSAMNNQFILAATPVDIEESRRILKNEFRNSNLVIAEVQRMQYEHEQKIAEIRAILNESDSFDMKSKPIVFKPRHDVSFGILTTENANELIACIAENKIMMWDLISNKCVATLEGHTKDIHCLETIGVKRFASGSQDNTIRIWDAKNFVCLKTLTGHPFGVFSLKSLPSNRLASGSDGDIKIWNIESGKCLQTLNGHSELIYDLVYLSTGNLVSCSDDKTIKVWSLARGECTKTLTGHSSAVFSIVLLRNGQLASGSDDNTIKIWNMKSGKCVTTLKEHSDLVCRLLQHKSGELVSCSSDGTIKIWNLEDRTCIQTLFGHTSCVRSIRLNSQNNTIASQIHFRNDRFLFSFLV